VFNRLILQDVIKIFLVDGTCKGFLVTSTMTVNALKFLVAQKTNVDKTDWNNFGVFMATREKIGTEFNLNILLALNAIII
jgi:hypothetical protein